MSLILDETPPPFGIDESLFLPTPFLLEISGNGYKEFLAD